MNKQQFIEKTINEIKTKYLVRMPDHVIAEKLSECWDMAVVEGGKDFAKRFITLMRRQYDLHENMHYSEVEDNLNSLTSK